MSDRRHTRAMVACAIAGLIMAYYAKCGPAYANPMVLERGTTIKAPGQTPVVLDASHFLVTRSQLDKANAAAETSRKLTEQLRACTRRVIRVTRPEPQWRAAARWTLTGLAIGGAFALGVVL